MQQKLTFFKGLKDGIPICMGYLSVSFTFGMMASKGGLPLWVIQLISMTNLTSAGQFAGTALVLAGGAYLEVAVTTLVINLRYMLMSFSLSQKLDPEMPWWERALLAFGNTDEIFAVAMGRTAELSFPYMVGLQILPVFGWTAGTATGAIAGNLLPASLTSALGVALYGMFIAVVVPVARRVRPVLAAALLAVCLSCVLYVTGLSTGLSIIVCTVTASAVMAFLHPVEGGEEA